MNPLSRHMRTGRLVAAILFAVGNSGVAAVVTSCDIDDEAMMCCRPIDDCRNDIGDQSVSIADPNATCMISAIAGGLSIDGGLVPSPDEQIIPSGHSLGLVMMSVQTGPATSAVPAASLTSPPASAPPILLLTSALLI